MAEEVQYRIRSVQPSDTDDVMKLLRRTFFIDEPMNKAVGLCIPEICTELEDYCSHALSEGLSFKAVDSEDNIVGVMISGECELKDDNGNGILNYAQKCENPKFQKILYILAKRESGARLWERFPHERMLVDVKIAATDPSWRKKGIMKALLIATEKATLERSIKLIRMDTSSAYSAMLAERLGYTCVYSTLYKDIKMDGKPLIVPEPPHTTDSVYVKMLVDNVNLI